MIKSAPPIVVEDKGLKHNALSFAGNVVIGVASTAPAYSLASALGAMAVIVGVGVPAILLAAFVPMLCVAAACYHLNRIDPSCGTTFSWVTRAMGPYVGWMGGWAVIVTNILVMPNLAMIAGQYGFRLFGISDPATWMVTLAGLTWIAVMTAICYRGIEASARIQRIFLIGQLGILVVFAIVALVKVYAGRALPDAAPVSFGWFDPFAVGTLDQFSQALLVAVFIYWGWDTGLSVNEETENPAEGPGQAALVSNVLLVVLYVMVATAAVAFAGPALLAKNSADAFAPLGLAVLGPGLDKLLIAAVLFSASACTLTSILPNARTALAMATVGAMPERFAQIHPRFKNPDFGTLVTGGLAMTWFVALSTISQNVLEDSVLALGLCISFYYALTAFACVILHRRELTQNVGAFVSMGLLPVAGGVMMTALFVQSIFALSRAGTTSILGMSGPLVIGLGSLLLGVVPMLLMRARNPFFFARDRHS